MRLHGMNRDAFDRFTAKVPSWYYEVVAPGFKYNLTDIAAALGLHQLKRAQGFQARRAEIAARYDAAFQGLPLVTPPLPAAGDRHAWHLYALRLGDGAGMARDRFIEALFDQGIGCSVHYIPLHLHPYWRDRYGLQAADFPHSQHAYERLVSLPIYTRMNDADVDRVVAAVRRALGLTLAGFDRRRRPMPKRAFDLVVATVALLLLAPALLLGSGLARSAGLTRAGVLPPGTGRAPGQAVSHPQVPHHGG
jgi:dTDP-4-amino-4,6-dideoxygalactose transaminase